MRNPWSVGILMIAMGGLSIGGMGTQKPLGPVAYVVAGILIAGGASLFLRHRATFFFALFASLVCALSGVAARFGHPELAMPIPWWLSVVVGLYLCVRVPLTQVQPKRRSNDEDGRVES